MSTVIASNIPLGDIQFYDNYLPALDAGTYRIAVEQQIDGINTEGFFQNPITQDFEVRGPQFALNPNDVHSMYPPVNGSGRYANYLPYIVLNERVLPWERELIAGEKEIPWMALFVLDDNEVQRNGDGTILITSTVKDLLAPNNDILKPAINAALLSQKQLEAQCQSVVLSSEVFAAVVPRKEELAYLAHCRQVNTGDRAIDGENDDGWFSLVMANRFPNTGAAGSTAGGRNHVFLVSLEGFSAYVGNNPQLPKKKLQLAVLATWSFVALPDPGESFAALMENFVKQEAGNPDNLLLKIPVPEGRTNAATPRLNNGYAALSYHTASGEDTFAWYRGPFTPVVPQPLPNAEALTTASAATIYDATNGVFDLSYAAAWQLGRSLALADRDFSAQLMVLRRRAHQTVNRLLRRMRSPLLNSNGNAVPLAALAREHNPARLQFNTQLSNGLGQRLTALFQKPLNNPQEPVSQSSAPFPLAVATIRSFVAQESVQEVLQKTLQSNLSSIADWLAKLALLESVPFNHLVPDNNMLPVESLRFFYLDPSWLDALADGALSVGIQSSRDTLYQTMVRGNIRTAMLQSIHTLRAQRFGLQASAVQANGESMAFSGFLMRSALVSGWPGMVIRAYKNNEQLLPVKFERLSSSVLLCIFPTVPDTLTFSEPQQGFRFGVEDSGIITLRSLSEPVGKPLDKTFKVIGPGFTTYERNPAGTVGQRVLNINATIPSAQNNVVPALTQALGLSALSSADFAIQFVKAPEQLTFKPRA